MTVMMRQYAITRLLRWTFTSITSISKAASSGIVVEMPLVILRPLKKVLLGGQGKDKGETYGTSPDSESISKRIDWFVTAS